MTIQVEPFVNFGPEPLKLLGNLEPNIVLPVRKDSQTTLSNHTYHSNCSIQWAVKQQRGFRYQNNMKFDSHPYIEDAYFPTAETKREKYCSIHGDYIFIVADGHAGHEAADWFIERLSDGVMNILNSTNWSFDDCSSRADLTSHITDLFVTYDKEYTALKINQFQAWKNRMSPPASRPQDDGCTMVLNIIKKGWLLNCNLGDSRTVIARPSMVQSGWITHYASVDHNMTNPQKVDDIRQRGGVFINPIGPKKLYVPIKQKGQDYPELLNARLFRPNSPVIEDIGCSHRRTLNLTGTLGDLLFKIEPPIISSVPDFSFIKLDPQENLIIMATDGLWDHLHAHKEVVQNEIIVETVTTRLSNIMERSFGDTEMYEPNGNNLLDALEIVCEELIDREYREDDLFIPNLIRYDDITVMIIHLDS